MARTNKYTSLNFNDIYDKKINHPSSSTTTSRSPSSSSHPHKSYSLSASSRLTHGGMLVLSRPSPKPQPSPQQPQPPPQPPSSESTTPPPLKTSDFSDFISLRPKGNTGETPKRETSINTNTKVDAASPKTNKFVPPHLRPGYVAKEVAVVPEFQKPRQGSFRPGSAHGNFHGSPNRFTEDGRPKSGSGYERRMRAPGPVFAESDSIRPRSGGNWPS